MKLRASRSGHKAMPVRVTVSAKWSPPRTSTWNLFVIDSGATSPANTGDDHTYK
jgi:hypothetical protein